MEAEYVAFSMSMNYLLSVIRTVKGVADAVGLDAEETSNMHIYGHEANAGCIVFGQDGAPTDDPTV